MISFGPRRAPSRTGGVAHAVLAGLLGLGLVGLLGLLGGVAILPPTHAQPEDLSFELDFGILVLDTPSTRVGTIELGRDARLEGLAWVERTGVMADVDLTVTVCDRLGTCVDAASPTRSAVLTAGPLHTEVTATLHEPAMGTGRAIGRLTFGDGASSGIGRPELPGLAPTGADVATSALWSLAFLSAGVALAAWATRTRARAYGSGGRS